MRNNATQKSISHPYKPNKKYSVLTEFSYPGFLTRGKNNWGLLRKSFREGIGVRSQESGVRSQEEI
ncbi:MAG: hypothetical protein ACKPEO_03035 [Sphaerospermopsis kisseleviana]